jgi:hypothetical protein
MGSAGGDGLAEGGGGSFAPEVPPTQQQILPFHAIKEISTSPLGSAPQFRVIKQRKIILLIYVYYL